MGGPFYAGCSRPWNRNRAAVLTRVKARRNTSRNDGERFPRAPPLYPRELSVNTASSPPRHAWRRLIPVLVLAIVVAYVAVAQLGAHAADTLLSQGKPTTASSQEGD